MNTHLMVPGGFPLAEMQVATGVLRLEERATSVGVDRLIWVVGRTERIWWKLLILIIYISIYPELNDTRFLQPPPEGKFKPFKAFCVKM